MAMKIKTEDTVIVLAGKDKGKTGTVKVVTPQGRVIVSGVNMCKKHQKPNPQLGVEGGVVEREASLHISNVAYLNPLTNKAERIGFKKLEDGRKVRLMKSSREIINDE